MLLSWIVFYHKVYKGSVTSVKKGGEKAMKNQKLLSAICIIVGLGIFCIPGLSRASLYNGAWKPIQDNNFSAMSVDFDNPSHPILSIYDYDNRISRLPVIEDMPLKNEYSSGYNLTTHNNLYQLSSSQTGMTVVTIDSPSSMTIPTAMYLLGSGLLGLVVIGRKSQR